MFGPSVGKPAAFMDFMHPMDLDCKRLPFPTLTGEKLQDIELKPHSLVFPTPLLKMPHELHLGSAPDYVQKDGRTVGLLGKMCRAV